MKKVRANASWNELSPKHRRKLEEWLFDERLSYNEVLVRAKKELGFSGSRASLQRFYERTAQERNLDHFAEAGLIADAVDGVEVSAERLQRSGMKIVAQAFIRQVTADPENVKQWGFLAKLLLYGEENQLRREQQHEDSTIRRERLAFSKLRYQYDMINRALEALPELQALDEARKEESMTVLEKNKAWNDMRRRMFGEVIPDLLPETEEELANPEIIKQRFQEMIKRPMYWYKDGTYRYAEPRPAQPPVNPPPEPPVVPPPEVASAPADPDGFTEEERLRFAREDANDGVGDPPERAAKKTPRSRPAARRTTPVPEPIPATIEDQRPGASVEPPADPPIEAAQTPPEPEPAFVDEPRRLTLEERQKEYEELMQRARRGSYP